MQIHLHAVGNLGRMVLKVAERGLEVITLSHYDREKVVIILPSLLVGDVLGEKRFKHFIKTMERM